MNTEISKIYDTLLSVPGMGDNVKLELRLPRKSAFLLAKVIERGITQKEAELSNSILSNIQPEALDELKAVPEEILKKAGLNEMNEKLKVLK